MENLQSITIAGTVNELNNTSLNAFVKGIDGLTLSQAQAALSTRALTDAQKEQILASAGLLQSTQAITLEEVKQMASSMSLSTKKKEEILTTLQGAYAENEWNKEKLEAIVASGGEAGAIAESILAKKAENVENTKNIAGRKALTASLKEELATRLALMASNPVVWIAGIAAVSVGLIALQEKFSKSLEECTEELEGYNSEFDTAQSSVESLETELKTCTSRLDELQKLADNGTISIIEQEEYERLQKTNDELERNIRIEREKAQLMAIDAAKSADETLSKTVESKYVTSLQDFSGVGVLSEYASWITPQEELQASISEYNKLQKQIDALNQSYDNGSISTDDYNKQLIDLTDQQAKARTRASEMSDILVECEQAYKNLDNTGGELSSTQTANYQSVEVVNQKYQNFLGTINDVNESLNNLNDTETNTNLTDEKSVSLDSAKESVTGLAEEYTLLQEILKDTANVSEETYTKLLACSSKYSAAIRTENGRITLNTTKLKQVAKQRQLDTKATIKETLALKKQEWLQWRNKMSIFNGELLTSIEEKYGDIGALEAEITQYELLMNTIDQCANAFERFKAAQQTEDQDMYNTAQDAFNVLKEYSSDSKSENYGKFNRDEFQEAALLLMDNETYRKALNAKDLEEYTGIVNDFVKEVTPLFDENNAKSASNLFDQINKILESGDVPEADVDWAERLGISQEMFHALEQLANQYDFNNKEIFESFQLNKLDDLNEKTQAVADAEAALAAETDKTSNSYLYYSNVLQEAKQKRAQLVNETISDTKESFDNWNSQTGDKSSFGEYLKAQLDYDETDIAGVAMMIQEKMQSISDNIAKMPSSVDTTSMQEQYQSLGDILTSLGYTYEEVDKQASALNQSSNNDEQISQYDRCVQLLQQRKKLEQDLAIMDVSSPEFTTTLNQLEGINTQIGLLKDPITIQLNADLDNVKSQLADIQKQKEEVQQSIQVSGSSAGAGDFKKLDYLNMQEQDLQNQQSVIEQKLKIITEGDEEANSAINELSSANIDDKTFNISANDTNAISKIDEINSKKIDDKTFNISANVSMPTISFGGNKSTGENHAKGTVGNAFASGYNGLPKDEKGALRSEYGQKELTVYPNGQYEITDTPTMSDLPKGTVIFNEEQTKRILKGNTHANGTVGNAFLDGTGTKVNVPNFIDVTTNNPAIKKASKEVEDTIDETTEDIEEASEEIFDWIERKIKKLQRLYDRWISNAEKTFSTKFVDKFFSHANSNLNKQLKTQSAAFDRYMQEANNSGLSDDYKQKVADGLIDIEKIADENLSKQINDYQSYFDKATDSLTAFEEASEKKFNLPLEKATQKIELFKNQIDLLGKKIDNTIGYKAKNKLVDDQTKQEEKTLSAYKQASKAAQKNLNSQKKNMTLSSILNGADISKKEKKQIKANVKNGKELDLLWFKEGSKAYQAAVKYNDALRANEQATLDLANAQEDYNSWLQEAAKLKFDNIADFYSNQINLLDMSQKKIEDRISLLEAKGMSVNAKYYQGEIDYIKASRQQNEQKYAELSESLDKMEKDGLRGTDAWWEEVEALSAVNDAITQCDINIAEMNNKITETSETLINKVLDGVKSVSEEMEFMTGLMSKMDMFFEDSGAFTDEGLATMGGYASSANNSKYAQNYVDGLVKAFEQAKKDGKLEFTYDGQLFRYNSNEQRNNAELEWIKTLKDATQDYYDYTNKQIDMMIEKYQAELSALKEIVDCRKDALSATKDLHDYQKSITDSVKNAASLEKQIAALQGNNSEENMMKIQKLQKELDDANSDIAEKEYDRYISDQQNMLDKLYSEYEALINQKTKDRNKLLVEANTIAQATQDTIKDTFIEYGEKYNYTDYLGTIKTGLTTLTGNDSPLNDIKKNVFDAVQSEGAIGQIPTAIGNVNTTLGGIATTVKSILEAYTKPPITDNNSSSGSGSSTTNTSDKDKALVSDGVMSALTGLIQKADFATEKSTNATANATGSVANAINKVAQIISGTSQNKNTKTKALDYINGSAGKPSKKKSEYSDVNQKIWDLTNGKVLSSSELKKLAEIIGVKYNNATKSGNLYKGLKSLGIKGFKRGGIAQLVKNNGEDGIALARNGEGFIAPEHVKPIQDLVHLTPQLSEMLKPIVDLPKLPNIQTLDRNSNVSIDIGNIELPNVTNPKEFASQLVSAVQRDKTVQNTLRELTDIPINRNYNRLSINKYK